MAQLKDKFLYNSVEASKIFVKYGWTDDNKLLNVFLPNICLCVFVFKDKGEGWVYE